MTQLLGRRVRVQIGLPGEPGLELTFSPENGGTGYEIGFSIDHKLDGKPSKGDVEIYNAPPAALRAAQQKACLVRVFAGYDVERLLFQGNPLPRYGADSSIDGGDRVLKVAAQDGRRAYQLPNISRSWGTEVYLSEVVRKVAEDMATTAAPLPASMSTFEFPQGLTLTGKPRDALKSLSAAIGATAMIRDGVLFIVEADGVTGEPAVVFSPEQGNLFKVTPQKDGIVSIHGALDGSVRPGRRFVIKDHPDYSGVYKARDVSFRGSSGFDTPFDVIATGKAVNL